MACQTLRSTSSEMKRVEPSMMSAFTPPGCMLRAVACSVSVYEQQGIPSRTNASSPKASWT